MATREITGGREATRELELKEKIKEELRRKPTAPQPKDAPTVFIDKSGIKPYRHYYVVWNKFKGVDSFNRFSIIYDAIHEALGLKEVTRAMTVHGLTSSEARKMGLKV
ncbi:MAG TPA: hypothetical protein VKX17_11895 [Planctomycetota bacterium]|nr:hypothetical protein [Planctomycetota bacterium]